MSNTSFNEAVHTAAKEVANLVIRKQKDYGPKNIMNSVVSPELSIAVRLNDKLARLANLVQKGANPENESLRDTADDIIGYGLVLKMVLEETFLNKLEEKDHKIITTELDDIMEDLITGHNFDYAREVIVKWHNKHLDEKIEDETTTA